jgi:hypothetical protein
MVRAIQPAEKIKTMYSKIKIDCDHEGKPVIILNVSHDTSDLRDKMLKMFTEGIGYESNWLRIDSSPSSGANETTYTIRPISNVEVLHQEVGDRLPSVKTPTPELQFFAPPCTIKTRVTDGDNLRLVCVMDGKDVAHSAFYNVGDPVTVQEAYGRLVEVGMSYIKVEPLYLAAKGPGFSKNDFPVGGTIRVTKDIAVGISETNK